MLCSDSLLKSRSHCHDFNADFPRQIVDVLVVVNREHLPTIRSFHEYLQPFYGEATNIEDTHTIMNWNLQDPRPSTVQNDRGMNLLGTNYDNTRQLQDYRRFNTIIQRSMTLLYDWGRPNPTAVFMHSLLEFWDVHTDENVLTACAKTTADQELGRTREGGMLSRLWC